MNDSQDVKEFRPHPSPKRSFPKDLQKIKYALSRSFSAGVITRFGRRTSGKSQSNGRPHSFGEHKFYGPKRRFWKELQKMKCAVSDVRSTFRWLVAQIECSHQRKRTSKTRISSFVTISKSSFGAQVGRHTFAHFFASHTAHNGYDVCALYSHFVPTESGLKLPAKGQDYARYSTMRMTLATHDPGHECVAVSPMPAPGGRAGPRVGIGR